jgi:hypothetical protein
MGRQFRKKDDYFTSSAYFLYKRGLIVENQMSDGVLLL